MAGRPNKQDNDLKEEVHPGWRVDAGGLRLTTEWHTCAGNRALYFGTMDKALE